MEKEISAKGHPADTVQKNIDTIIRLEKEAVKNLSPVEHIADKVTNFAGSRPFILLPIICFGGWYLIDFV